ncbi:MAG: ferrous iron transport protein A [Chloroflexi bacterium]|nr:MAG: ferrous iron transport protein A [Chloroflexota bacterium]
MLWPNSLKPLSEVLPGQKVQVESLRGGRGFVARLAALGFTPGAEVIMVQNYGYGPVIVSIRGSYIALGRGEAAKVLVKTR